MKAGVVDPSGLAPLFADDSVYAAHADEVLQTKSIVDRLFFVMLCTQELFLKSRGDDPNVQKQVNCVLHNYTVHDY